jgi:hypothetical protein
VHVLQFTAQLEGPARLQPARPFTTGADGMVRTAIALTWDGGRFDRWVYAVVPGRVRLATAPPTSTTGNAVRVTVHQPLTGDLAVTCDFVSFAGAQRSSGSNARSSQ